MTKANEIFQLVQRSEAVIKLKNATLRQHIPNERLIERYNNELLYIRDELVRLRKEIRNEQSKGI